MSVTPPVDQALVFATAAEGLNRRFGDRLPPALFDELRSIGFDLHAPAPAYPLELWDRVLRRIVQSLYPELPLEAQLRTAGREYIGGFVETALGRGALIAARVLGPKRTLLRMNRNLQNAGNYIQCDGVASGENEVALVAAMRPPYLPHWAG